MRGASLGAGASPAIACPDARPATKSAYQLGGVIAVLDHRTLRRIASHKFGVVVGTALGSFDEELFMHMRRWMGSVTRILWVVMAVVMVAASAEAAPRKGKRKGKGKGKQPAAAAQPTTP